MKRSKYSSNKKKQSPSCHPHPHPLCDHIPEERVNLTENQGDNPCICNLDVVNDEEMALDGLIQADESLPTTADVHTYSPK